eukprot:TRINITY_DN397_c0_g1_i4.p1 TRINITY_DN397_c0_g1~~TRINITY_DN397_c0_g1_i4.p1  ORF type:complete len:1035 (+),score=369.72 TRINITY_DN397_c0_g1_i4:49-3153(+)
MGNEQGRVLSPEEMKAREISQMDSEMRRKLSRGGVKYNVKVVIKGDRNTGKTSLWRRLSGLPFLEEYVPTPEIQCANINWNYKASDDVVKVEVWDIVDKAKPRRQGSTPTLKTSTSGSTLKASTDDDGGDASPMRLPPQSPNAKGSFAISNLDAETIDIFQGTHGVIIMMDPTKKWTWDYVQREVPKIPPNIYVLVISNFRDMADQRAVSEYEIKEYCKNARPPPRGEPPTIRHMEASMLNGYGLKAIVSFFNVPFLHMQRRVIQQQLDRNAEEISSAEEELKLIAGEQNYATYLQMIENNQRQKKTGSTPVTTPPSSPTPTLPAAKISPSPSVESIAAGGKPLGRSSSLVNALMGKNEPAPTPVSATQSQSSSSLQGSTRPRASTTAAPAASPAPVPQPAEAQPAKKSFFSKFTDMVTSKVQSKPEEAPKAVAAPAQTGPVDIDNFNPGDVDDDFFEEEKPKKGIISTIKSTVQREKPATKPKDDDDDDDDLGNPMVAQDEDLDEDMAPVVVTPPKRNAAPAPTPVSRPAPKPAPVRKDDDSDEEGGNPMVAQDEDLDDDEDFRPAKSAPLKKTATPPVTSPKISKPAAQQARPSPSPVTTKPAPVPAVVEEDSDDDEGGNPMVTRDADLDEDDEDFKPVPKRTPAAAPAAKSPSITSPMAIPSPKTTKTSAPTTPISSVTSAPKPSTSLPVQPSKHSNVKGDTSDDNDDDDVLSSFVAQDEDIDFDDDIPKTPTPTTKKTAPLPSSPSPSKPAPISSPAVEDSDEDEGGNPLIMQDEDVDFDDDEPVIKTKATQPPPAKPSPKPQTPPIKTSSSAPAPLNSVDDFVVEEDVDFDDDTAYHARAEPIPEPAAESISEPESIPEPIPEPEAKEAHKPSERNRDDRDRRRDRDREKDRDRERDKERGDRDREKDRDRERDKERGDRDREKDRDRERDRRNRSERSDRDRDRDRDRDEAGRSRRSDRDRPRDKDGDRERPRDKDRGDRDRERDRDRAKDRPRDSRGPSDRRVPKEEAPPQPTRTKEEQDLDDFYAD